MIGLIGCLLIWAAGLCIGYAMWFPARQALFSLVPANEWAGVLKIMIVVGIGYFGGIGIPFVFLISGVVFLIAANRS